jgi:hypothetical protein
MPTGLHLQSKRSRPYPASLSFGMLAIPSRPRCTEDPSRTETSETVLIHRARPALWRDKPDSLAGLAAKARVVRRWGAPEWWDDAGPAEYLATYLIDDVLRLNQDAVNILDSVSI